MSRLPPSKSGLDNVCRIDTHKSDSNVHENLTNLYINTYTKPAEHFVARRIISECARKRKQRNVAVNQIVYIV